MNREIKFRAWYQKNNDFIEPANIIIRADGCIFNRETGEEVHNVDLLQYTGLKDKNGLQEVYEGDIIDTQGNVKGNIYEMDKEKTDFVIQGLGTKTWCETYSRAILLGLKNSE